MRSNKNDIVRFKHILFAIEEIEEYLFVQSYESFINNSMMRNATVRQLEIIGEAVSKISNETKGNYPELDWKAISGMRNILIHEYFGVNYNLVWLTAKNDLSKLKAIAKEIIQDENILF